MRRYIDACLAIQYIHDHYRELDFMDSGVPAEMERVVQSIPTADVRPVVHAHWEDVPTPYKSDELYLTFACSDCDYKTTELSNFCPHCGAIMDEEEEE